MGDEQSAEKAAVDRPRLAHIRERLAAYRPAPDSPTTNRAVEDMQHVLAVVDDQRLTELVLRGEIRRSEAALATFDAVVAERDDLRSRLACVAEATYWDRPYDTRLAAIRGMCDLTTDGMTPTAGTTGHAEAAAEALEEAADERGELWSGGRSVHHDCAEMVGGWLHERATAKRSLPGDPS